MKNKADNKKRNFLTHSEIESLLKAANTGPHAARNYCLTLLCFIHGFRASEICRLRISDIDLKAKCIYMGLPRSWWEDSVRHIQFPIVEHNSQFKRSRFRYPLAFILSSLILLFSASAFPFETR